MNLLFTGLGKSPPSPAPQPPSPSAPPLRMYSLLRITSFPLAVRFTSGTGHVEDRAFFRASLWPITARSSVSHSSPCMRIKRGSIRAGHSSIHLGPPSLYFRPCCRDPSIGISTALRTAVRSNLAQLRAHPQSSYQAWCSWHQVGCSPQLACGVLPCLVNSSSFVQCTVTLIKVEEASSCDVARQELRCPFPRALLAHHQRLSLG